MFPACVVSGYSVAWPYCLEWLETATFESLYRFVWWDLL